MCASSLRGALAAKQSNLAARWIASLTLAMTITLLRVRLRAGERRRGFHVAADIFRIFRPWAQRPGAIGTPARGKLLVGLVDGSRDLVRRLAGLDPRHQRSKRIEFLERDAAAAMG